MNFPTFVLVLTILGFSESFSQPCIDFTTAVNKHSKEEYFKFREQIPLDDEKWKLALTVDALTDQRSVVIVFIANPPLCFKKNDSIAFTFTSGRVFVLQNIMDDNCEQKAAVAFNLANGADMNLDSLITSDLASVCIHSNGKKIRGDLRNNRKPVLRSSLRCLRDVLISESALQSFRDAESNIVFTIVDQQPEFPGGYSALQKFITSNQRKQRTRGTVFLSFIVEKDGALSEPRVLKGISREADAEALRVLKLMPNWIPGSHAGKPARVHFVFPVNFK
jgi:TonB family protein